MVVNLTPHAITTEKGGVRVTYFPSGTVVRVTFAPSLPAAPVEGLPTVTVGVPMGIGFDGPPPCEGSTAIVSRMALDAIRAGVPGWPSGVRAVAPDTGPSAIRENGNVVAVRGFVE